MRRPHVFERSAPRRGLDAHHEPANQAWWRELSQLSLGT